VIRLKRERQLLVKKRCFWENSRWKKLLGRSLCPRTFKNVLHKRKKISELRGYKFQIDNQQVIVVMDPGSEVCVLSEDLFKKLTAGAMEILVSA
jgi:hypothetical protein